MWQVAIPALVLLASIGTQYAFACSTHGGPNIGISDITPLSGGMWELRFTDFTTIDYSSGDMCSCAFEVLNGWDIDSAQFVFSGTSDPVTTFPEFSPDTNSGPLSLTSTLESLYPTSSLTKWIALKNIIPATTLGGDSVDLIIRGTFPGATESTIIQALDGNLVVIGKLNNEGNDYDGDHFQVLTIFEQLIGGKIISLDTTTLLLAGMQTSLFWILPVILASVGLIAFRKMRS
jgi:hypothetical protein